MPATTNQPPQSTSIDDEREVVPAALRRLRQAAHDCCHAAAHNGFYPAHLDVSVLADSTAALAELAGWVAPYAGDFWPAAGSAVDTAATALATARGHLDSARHHIELVPPGGRTVTVPA
ncbi:hypothetical protein [Dactylosporangium sp. CA-139066]|uniref:hypothetical protein n=1 Tax=Dactylosporangium sp. CA-139066 TaxID=3239930 RepID=UPI003D9175E8